MAKKMRDVEDDIQTAPARSDAYTGMLVISLGAMITGCALLYLDYAEYPTKQPTMPAAPISIQQAGQGGGALGGIQPPR